MVSSCRPEPDWRSAISRQRRTEQSTYPQSEWNTDMRIPVGSHLERHSLPALLLPAEEPGPPSTAFPGASPAAAPVPQTYPAPGPTFDSFLYSQIAASATTG